MGRNVGGCLCRVACSYAKASFSNVGSVKALPKKVTPTGNPGGCSGQKLLNPGFESGSASWTATAGVIGQNGSQGQPTHGGTWNAWLDGYGRTHTDTLSQSVTIPSGCTATFTFYLHIDTAETTTTTAYDAKPAPPSFAAAASALAALAVGDPYAARTKAPRMNASRTARRARNTSGA